MKKSQRGIWRGNEQLLFHGTTRACLLGENEDETLPCDLAECNLCRILRFSFDVALAGSKHEFKRYVPPAISQG